MVLGVDFRLGWNVGVLGLAAEGEIGCPTEVRKNPAGLDNMKTEGYDWQDLFHEA